MVAEAGVKRASSTRPALFGFARQRRYEETVAALAELSRSSIEVDPPLDAKPACTMACWLPCRAAGLSWETAGGRAGVPLLDGLAWAPPNWPKRKAGSRRSGLDDARRLLGFWQVRSTTDALADQLIRVRLRPAIDQPSTARRHGRSSSALCTAPGISPL